MSEFHCTIYLPKNATFMWFRDKTSRMPFTFSLWPSITELSSWVTMSMFSGRAVKAKLGYATWTYSDKYKYLLRINLVASSIYVSTSKKMSFICFLARTKICRGEDDVGDSLDPLLTDEPVVGPPMTTDVERTIWPEIIYSLWIQFLYWWNKK